MTEPTSPADVNRQARERRAALYKKEVVEWSDEDLVWELTERYRPSVIPPCVVCGGPLSISAAGGGEPTRWACSPTENDPDRPGYVRNRQGRGGPEETDRSGHYSRSEYIDRRRDGDENVVELVRRFQAKGATPVTAAELGGTEASPASPPPTPPPPPEGIVTVMFLDADLPTKRATVDLTTAPRRIILTTATLDDWHPASPKQKGDTGATLWRTWTLHRTDRALVKPEVAAFVIPPLVGAQAPRASWQAAMPGQNIYGLDAGRGTALTIEGATGAATAWIEERMTGEASALVGEAWYDAEIAPVLATLSAQCQARKAPLLAVVEYEPGEVGRTVFLPTDPSLPMVMLNLLCRAGNNVDAFIISLMRYCKEKDIDTSASVVLTFWQRSP